MSTQSREEVLDSVDSFPSVCKNKRQKMLDSDLDESSKARIKSHECEQVDTIGLSLHGNARRSWIAGLPYEIIIRIFEHLESVTLYALSKTCSRFFLILKDESLWYKRRICGRSALQKPPFMSERRFAVLLIDGQCRFCSESHPTTIDWIYYLRMCIFCFYERMSQGPRLYSEEAHYAYLAFGSEYKTMSRNKIRSALEELSYCMPGRLRANEDYEDPPLEDMSNYVLVSSFEKLLIEYRQLTEQVEAGCDYTYHSFIRGPCSISCRAEKQRHAWTRLEETAAEAAQRIFFKEKQGDAKALREISEHNVTLYSTYF